MDMSLELFGCISQDIMQRTNFGQRYRETNTEIVNEITDIPKAKYLFKRMDLGGFEAALSNNNLQSCEVLVSNHKHMELKFSKKKELFEVKFRHGYWNPSGVPQHRTNLT